MSRTLPDWVKSATAPSDSEVAHLLDGRSAAGQSEIARLATEATEPLSDEVTSLVRRGLSCAPKRARAPWLPRLVLAAVPLVLLLERPALDPPPGQVERSSDADIRYTTRGEGSWTQRIRLPPVDPLGEHVEIDQIEGVVRYQVIPLVLGQRFIVHARSVDVEVVGTVFDVGLDERSVWVSVIDGRVSVSTATMKKILLPGERWNIDQPELVREGTRAVLLEERAEEEHVAGVSAVAPTVLSGPEVPRGKSQAASYASLLERTDLGERSETLVAELEAFAVSAEGPLSDAALVTALEVSADVRSPKAVIDTIDWFLLTRPRTAHRNALLALRGDLARNGLRDCGLALPSYRELAGTSSGAQQARAEALRGLCAASVGRVDEARTALLSSLQLGLEPPLWSEVHAALDAIE